MAPVWMKRVGRRVDCFIDNEAVRIWMIKACASTVNCARLLSSYIIDEVMHPSLTWYARVPSYSNPADAPSRMRIEQTCTVYSQLVWLEPVVPDSLASELGGSK
eukprot:4076693-Amphidinium_carterae.1